MIMREFAILAVIALVSLLYAAGAVLRSPRGRNSALLFASGLAATAAALIWPVGVLAHDLFAAHMVQHMLLMDVAAPLLVLGHAGSIIRRGTPLPLRRAASRSGRRCRQVWLVASRPAMAAVIHAVVLWGWHAPSVFAAAKHNEALHVTMHVSFFLAGLIFWSALLRPRRAALGASVFWLFMTLMHAGFLGALITFAPVPLYETGNVRVVLDGLSALEDQQLAGLAMWVFSIAVYLGAAVAIAAHWFEAMAKASARQPGAPPR